MRDATPYAILDCVLDSRYPELTCSIARALEVVGERWTLLIIRDATRGVSRFEDFRHSLGIARNVLSARLEHLVAEGVLERRPYGSGGRSEYALTDKGRDLAVALIALLQWGDAHYPAAGGPPRVVTHDQCGGPIRATLVCTDESKSVAADAIAVHPGPSADQPPSGVAAGSQ